MPIPTPAPAVDTFALTTEGESPQSRHRAKVRRRRNQKAATESKRTSADGLGHLAAAIVEQAITHAQGRAYAPGSKTSPTQKDRLQQEALRYLANRGGVIQCHLAVCGLDYDEDVAKALEARLETL